VVLAIALFRRRNQIRTWRLRRNIRHFERLMERYQTDMDTYVQSLNDMLNAFHTHGARGHPAVVAAVRASNRQRRGLAGLERDINASVRTIIGHRGFSRLDAHTRAGFAANVRTIYGNFGGVTSRMIMARRLFRGPSGRVTEVPPL
jgi:hypothetical protein